MSFSEQEVQNVTYIFNVRVYNYTKEESMPAKPKENTIYPKAKELEITQFNKYQGISILPLLRT